MAVYVISKHGERLMPTTRYGRVRHLLKEGNAHIVKHEPFTIQLDYESTTYVQDMELCVDAGAQHIGVSLKSEDFEYESDQYDLLPDEKERHDNARRYRRDRRNRKRYRAPRFDNRRKKDGWLAPSLQNKADRHIDIVQRFVAVAPVRDVYLEVGQFDIQVLSAVQEGRPIPQGVGYQRGEQYGTDTLREAVFQRDHYKCKICGRDTFKDGAILHAHHAYYWRGQHGDRLSELMSVCERCHTSANHQKGGKLWGYDKRLPRFVGAAFMNSVRWYIYNRLKETLPCNVHLTFGAATKRSRLNRKLPKSHTNDAYSMGRLHPISRIGESHFVKRRRNNRCLEKFYDAKVIDVRTGETVKGSALGCERTNRREPRNSDKSLRKYRGAIVKHGRRSIRTKRHPIQAGDVVMYKGIKIRCRGSMSGGKSVLLFNKKESPTGKAWTAKPENLVVLRHASGWDAVNNSRLSSQS